MLMRMCEATIEFGVDTKHTCSLHNNARAVYGYVLYVCVCAYEGLIGGWLTSCACITIIPQPEHWRSSELYARLATRSVPPNLQSLSGGGIREHIS